MGKRRTSAELDIHIGAVRSFEWFWSSDEQMPGLDDFEALDEDDQAAVIATFEYWGDLELGKRVSETRVNEENANPKILAAKAAKYRFSMFHAGDNVWVVERLRESRARWRIL